MSKTNKAVYEGKFDEFHKINLIQIMFSCYNALIIEINNKNVVYMSEINLTTENN